MIEAEENLRALRSEMASGFDMRLPQPLDTANLAKEWPRWKQAFAIYLRANNKIGESEENKIATFLWLVGPRGVEIYNSLYPNDGSVENMFGREPAAAADGADDDVDDAAGGGGVGNGVDDNQNRTRTLTEVILAFDNYCLPRKNVAMEAFKFNLIAQKEKQSFGDFETELRTQVQYCDFKCSGCQLSYSDRMIRDRIIIGVQDKKLQLKLLDGKDDPLPNVIETCKIFEAAAENRQLLDRKAGPLEVKTVEHKPNETKTQDEVDSLSRNTCYNCGKFYHRNHRRNCPAAKAVCHICGEVGHFKSCCRMKDDGNRSRVNRATPLKDADIRANQATRDGGSGNRVNQATPTGGWKKSVQSVNWTDAGKREKVYNARSVKYDSEIDSCRIISNVQEIGRAQRWKKVYRINEQSVEFKLDTGSDVNCIPLSIFKKVDVPITNFVDGPVFDYSSNKINIHGKTELKCVDPTNSVSHSAEFLIVDDGFEPLLGLKTCSEFGLIKRLCDVRHALSIPTTKKEFVNQYRDLFEGLGEFPGTCTIVLKPDSVPTLHYKKRIPLALHDRVKEELDHMVEQKVISPVDYPTDWVSNMQVVEKPNGKLRICLDPKPLNSCIKREHFLIPTQEDLFSRLSGKRVFSVLDLSSGFWQMKLDSQSSDLTTFMTPFGRYRWNRVPFGLNSAPEMFQRRMVQIFGDIQGVEIYFDDMAIAGVDEDDHDRILLQVILRARENNVKFNCDKLQFRQPSVSFMGHTIGEGKICPLDKDVRAVTEMPKPNNVTDVSRLLGLLKYLAKFIPNLSKRTSQLRNLTHNGVEWKWTEQHDEQFKDLCSSLGKAPVLAIFDPCKPCKVQTDSSKDGLGCVLLQENGPVAFASRTLSPSEQKWAQIEKELLAVVFACSRFHNFLYGREFMVESDHKPLENLIKRDIDDVTPRLQRMFLALLKYPGLSLVYVPGKSVLVADCLSRAPLPTTDQTKDQTDRELEGMVHTLTKRACMSKENYEHYVDTLNRDERFMRIVKYVQCGWPSYHALDDFSQLFYKYRHELHYENSLLFKDHKLVVPTELQSTICKWLHVPHLGIEKTLARARMQFFWPCMTNDLKEMVSQCMICEKFKRNNQKEPLVQDSIPDYPFQKVSTDIFEYGGHDWLVIIDSYSGFICCDRLHDKTMSSVCRLFDKFFNCYGYPTEIRSDNVPFNSLECDRYANRNNICLQFSSPRYPQSNGLAEKAVAIAKNILKRCYELGEVEQYQYHILQYNTTPVASMRMSPSQLFFGRQVKTRMPIDEALLMKSNLDDSRIRLRHELKRETQKAYYDRHAKPLTPLNEGQTVMFRKNSKDWCYGTVVRKVNDRSFVVKDSFGNHFHRNRRFLSSTTNTAAHPEYASLEDHAPVQTPDSQLKRVVSPPKSPLRAVTRNSLDHGLPNVSYPPVDNSEYHSDTSESDFLGFSEPESDSNSFYSFSSQSSDLPSHPPLSTRSGRMIVPPDRYGEWQY